jgi:hypothetical protein
LLVVDLEDLAVEEARVVIEAHLGFLYLVELRTL